MLPKHVDALASRSAITILKTHPSASQLSSQANLSISLDGIIQYKTTTQQEQLFQGLNPNEIEKCIKKDTWYQIKCGKLIEQGEHNNDQEGKEHKEFILNKSKVRKRVLAFANLNKSKKFLSFITMTFPCGMSDFGGLIILNIWLTRIRKIRPSFSYLWVCERQKNGTIHFHILTNEYLNIRIINHFAKVAIHNRLTDGYEPDINFDYNKYNGVDVRRIYNTKGVVAYITKYISKNDNKWNHLCWNCSSNISNLLVTQRITSDQLTKLLEYTAQKGLQQLDLTKCINYEHVLIIPFNKPPPQHIFREMEELNNYIYENLDTIISESKDTIQAQGK